MDKIVVQKSEPLKGEVTTSGAKNAALPIIFGSSKVAGYSIDQRPYGILGKPYSSR